jgi:hypothetical protein
MPVIKPWSPTTTPTVHWAPVARSVNGVISPHFVTPYSWRVVLTASPTREAYSFLQSIKRPSALSRFSFSFEKNRGSRFAIRFRICSTEGFALDHDMKSSHSNGYANLLSINLSISSIACLSECTFDSRTCTRFDRRKI